MRYIILTGQDESHDKDRACNEKYRCAEGVNCLDIVFVNRRIASPTVLPCGRFFDGKNPRKILLGFVGRFNTWLLFRWAKYHLFSSCNHLAGSALVCNVPF